MKTENENNVKVEQVTPQAKHFFFTTFGRILAIGIICILLLIPMVKIHFLVTERLQRQMLVNFDIKSEWGSSFRIEDPCIRVPKKLLKKGEKQSFLYIYPKTSDQKLKMDVSLKKRSLFKIPVFQGNLSGKYQFELSEKSLDYDFTKAEIGYYTNSSEQIVEITDFNLDGKNYPFYRLFSDYNDEFAHTNYIDLSTKSKAKLLSQITFQGCDNVVIREQSCKNKVSFSSNWADPIFHDHLPIPKSVEITKDGSHAKWSASNINRQGNNSQVNRFQNSNKGVVIEFRQAIDTYDLTDRTLKYAFLVILLTFIVFFMTEVMLKKIVHPLHYFMIGLALCIYYVIVLSVSEHFGFFTGYILASLTIVSIVAWYSNSILQSRKFAILNSIGLLFLYSFLLVLINLETYALITGTIGLLLVLIAIMSITKRIVVK
jgi:inner membrane protein